VVPAVVASSFCLLNPRGLGPLPSLGVIPFRSKYLLSLCAFPCSQQGVTPLMEAASGGHLECVQYLVEEAKCDLEAAADRVRQLTSALIPGSRICESILLLWFNSSVPGPSTSHVFALLL
jgi:hypothetical protein